MVLPLKLVVFERYMLADNRQHVPLAFQIRLIFSGQLDREKFRSALKQTLARHPLLSAHLDGEGTAMRWVAADPNLIHFDCEPAGVPMTHAEAAEIDLRRETGLRTWIRYDDREIDMRFQFHHSTCDGIGSYAFLDDLLRHYHALVRPDAPVEPLDIRPELLPQRTQLGLRWWNRLIRFPITALAVLHGGSSFLLRDPVELAVPQREPPDDVELRRVVDMPAVLFDRATLNKLSAVAKQARVKLNDLLTCEIIRAMVQWHERMTGRPWPGNLRVMVPMNLRTAKDAPQSATNIVGMVPLDRSPRSLARTKGFLRGIYHEMNYFKFFRFGVEFLNVVRTFEVIFGLKVLTDQDRCRATTTYSNMGRVFFDSTLPRIDGKLCSGGLTLERVESAPPTRRRTTTAFTSLSYNGTLSLIMNYDRLVMTEATARELLEHIGDRIRSTAHAEATSATETPARTSLEPAA